VRIPTSGKKRDRVPEELERFRKDDADGSRGRTFCSVFPASREGREPAEEACRMYLRENGLDPTPYPSQVNLENEITAMAAARPCLHKAAHCFRVKPVVVPVDPQTFRAVPSGSGAFSSTTAAGSRAGTWSPGPGCHETDRQRPGAPVAMLLPRTATETPKRAAVSEGASGLPVQRCGLYRPRVLGEWSPRSGSPGILGSVLLHRKCTGFALAAEESRRNPEWQACMGQRRRPCAQENAACPDA